MEYTGLKIENSWYISRGSKVQNSGPWEHMEYTRLKINISSYDSRGCKVQILGP